MVTVRPKTTVQQHIAATCPTHSRTDLQVRDLESVIDEPEERDGTNLGFTPTETLIASLIGCTNVISHKIAHKHGIAFDDMTIEAEATFDRRGASLMEEIKRTVPQDRADHRRADRRLRLRHGEGQDRAADVLPGLQGDPRSGHRDRGSLERDEGLTRTCCARRLLSGAILRYGPAGTYSG